MDPEVEGSAPSTGYMPRAGSSVSSSYVEPSVHVATNPAGPMKQGFSHRTSSVPAGSSIVAPQLQQSPNTVGRPLRYSGGTMYQPAQGVDSSGANGFQSHARSRALSP